jgi:hypothetical protein
LPTVPWNDSALGGIPAQEKHERRGHDSVPGVLNGPKLGPLANAIPSQITTKRPDSRSG